MSANLCGGGVVFPYFVSYRIGEMSGSTFSESPIGDFLFCLCYGVCVFDENFLY